MFHKSLPESYVKYLNFELLCMSCICAAALYIYKKTPAIPATDGTRFFPPKYSMSLTAVVNIVTHWRKLSKKMLFTGLKLHRDCMIMYHAKRQLYEHQKDLSS